MLSRFLNASLMTLNSLNILFTEKNHDYYLVRFKLQKLKLLSRFLFFLIIDLITAVAAQIYNSTAELVTPAGMIVKRKQKLKYIQWQQKLIWIIIHWGLSPDKLFCFSCHLNRFALFLLKVLFRFIYISLSWIFNLFFLLSCLLEVCTILHFTHF